MPLCGITETLSDVESVRVVHIEGATEYGWYICLDGDKIVGGLGVIDNDFHDRKDLAPNVCAVYTEEKYRCQGISGNLLNMVVEDMKTKGISPIYLVTDHVGFYERYGWEFFCMILDTTALIMGAALGANAFGVVVSVAGLAISGIIAYLIRKMRVTAERMRQAQAFNVVSGLKKVG